MSDTQESMTTNHRDNISQMNRTVNSGQKGQCKLHATYM